MNAPTPKNQTLLLVEDDYDIRAMLVMLLDMEGYHVVRATNGREALTLLEEGLRPHLILLDLMMPVMNGWQFREETLNPLRGKTARHPAGGAGQPGVLRAGRRVPAPL